jgi:hypothetical protein
LLSPEYWAVIVCWATLSRVEEAANVVTPEEFSVPGPRSVLPSKNSTLPVGTAAPVGPVTVAIKVTPCCLYVAGFVVEVTTTVGVALLTIWVAVPLLVRKLSMGLYVTVMVCDPTVRLDIVQVALPEASSVSVVVPVVLPSTANRTVPVGVAVPCCAVTVAVHVIGWNRIDGFGVKPTVVVVATWGTNGTTVWVSIGDVLPVKSVLPRNWAVMEYEPTAREDVE